MIMRSEKCRKPVLLPSGSGCPAHLVVESIPQYSIDSTTTRSLSKYDAYTKYVNYKNEVSVKEVMV